MTSPWSLSAQELSASRQQVSLHAAAAHSLQFAAAAAGGSKLSGAQARELFMKSALPPPTLAQIWALSDIDRDGALDEREFAIATKLVRNAQSGLPLPLQLPPSLLVQLIFSSRLITRAKFLMLICPKPFLAQPLDSQCISDIFVMPAAEAPTRQCSDWTIPQAKKLAYTQLFYAHDKQRVGWLAGGVARNAMGLSGLPMPVLAHIWTLADVDRDGRLSVGEFCIASHLIEAAKAGYALPDATPDEMLAQCRLERAAQEQCAAPAGDEPPAQRRAAPHTFEERRRDNFDKGQAELERRRAALREQEERARAELETRERAEHERRERERAEHERRQHELLQAERERQRELEAERAEQERKLEAQREAQRQEAEQARLAELAKAQLREAYACKEREAEATAQRQQRLKTLGFQLQALDERVVDTNAAITQARSRIAAVTHDIEGMRGERDAKMQRIAQLQTAHQRLCVRGQETAHAQLQLASAHRETSGQAAAIAAATSALSESRAALAESGAQLEQARVRAAEQQRAVCARRDAVAPVRTAHEHLRVAYADALQVLRALQASARQRLAAAKKHEPTPPATTTTTPTTTTATTTTTTTTSLPPKTSTASPPPAAAANAAPPTPTGAAVNYRAKYDFHGRSEDELSFAEGDLIIVFEGHASEPGWLAGQRGHTVGWFPAAFAEPVDSVGTLAQPIQSASDVVGSTSLDRIAEEESVICTCVAQFAWKARNEQDLSFAKGDRIDVLEQHEMKWRGRKADNSVGWFPKSYVKLLPESAADEKAAESAAAYDLPPGDVPPLYEAPPVTEDAPPPLYDAPPAVSDPSPNGDWYVASFDFDGDQDGDLPLRAGDKILVVERHDNWWRGECNGRSGIFPANYVAPAAAAESVCERARVIVDFVASASNQLALHRGELLTVRAKSLQGWWQGETVRDGTLHSGWFPGNYVVTGVHHDATETTPLPCSLPAVAAFDYTALQPDELSFSANDKIIVTAKNDAEWWTGHLESAPGVSGLFPSAYVTLQAAVSSPSDDAASLRQPTAKPRQPKHVKLARLQQELIESEQRHLANVRVALRVFVRPLLEVLPDELRGCLLEAEWSALETLSASLLRRLAAGAAPATALLAEIEHLRGFVAFCAAQRDAQAKFEAALQSMPAVAQRYAACCSDAAACGLNMQTLFLLPLGRISRYPLLLEKMAQCAATDADAAALDAATSVFASLLDDANRTISEQLLHCGTLWKARSGRLLVAILFNDMLLLTTPNEALEDLTPSLQTVLTTYRTPFMLHEASVSKDAGDDAAFSIRRDQESVALRASGVNAARLWLSSLGSAIEAAHTRCNPVPPSTTSAMGRLLVEIVSVDMTVTRTITSPICVRLGLHDTVELFPVDAPHASNCKQSTQLAFNSQEGMLRIALLEQRIYSPDVLVFEEVALPLQQLFAECSSHRGPIRKRIEMANEQGGSIAEPTQTCLGHYHKAILVIKLVVHTFQQEF